MAVEVSHYGTARPLLGALPGWIADKEEQMRVAAYDLYMGIYWNMPDTFKLVSRGQEDKPIYIPSGRTIVETVNRYLLPKFDVVVDPSLGTNDLATLTINDFMRRERFKTKVAQNKRYGLVRGDSMFLLHADPMKPEMTRISVTTLDPGIVFKITLADDVDAIIGYDIAELVEENGKSFVRRQTYMKQTMLPGPSPIIYTDELYASDKWGGPGMVREEAKLERVLAPAITLPAPIDDLPIYHFPNTSEPRQLWGSSEMRGMERIIAAVNQSISDEELSLAMEGLGVYTTDAGTPINDDGEEVAWDLGPGRVAELPEGKTLKRVSGVSSVSPYQDHLSYLHARVDEAIGMSDIAKGRVDVQTAESGIALMLELAPILTKSEEKDLIAVDVMNNLLFNLMKWFAAYEGGAYGSLIDGLKTRWIVSLGSAVPVNLEKAVGEILKLAAAKLISAPYARQKLRALGYSDMPDETVMQGEILQGIQDEAAVTQDAFGSRVDQAVQNELP